ncbi:hypothetical protein [uncultured Hoeflea sp.]|uniref:hypothetical protein n=1 Tax=uncultured Hoeflea sp. TaxID=538666 RepID=UPI0030D99F72|tara:strand:+ start:326 stop:1150 length:825 start_codon:yes stop_codon:yes gene_type:complete
MTWAANHGASLEVLREVQGSLTVDLIMVPRSSFETCTPGETAAQIKARNVDQFSYFPVVDEQKRVVGLYYAERWFDADAPNTPIGKDFDRLSEDIVIGADASIFDFVMQADVNSTNLVVSGNQIAGLVSLSDLQKLPVRAALFALITSLEMAMGLAITKRWPSSTDWLSLLSNGRREKLMTAIEDARARDSFVNEIAYTQFSDKADLIFKGRMLSQGRTRLGKSFRDIRDLRDSLSHANQYAETTDAAKNVCEVVRFIYTTKAELLKVIETTEK